MYIYIFILYINIIYLKTLGPAILSSFRETSRFLSEVVFLLFVVLLKLIFLFVAVLFEVVFPALTFVNADLEVVIIHCYIKEFEKENRSYYKTMISQSNTFITSEEWKVYFYEYLSDVFELLSIILSVHNFLSQILQSIMLQWSSYVCYFSLFLEISGPRVNNFN